MANFGPPPVTGWTIATRAALAAVGGAVGSVAAGVVWLFLRSGIWAITGSNLDFFFVAVVAAILIVAPTSLATAHFQAGADRGRFFPGRRAVTSHLVVMNALAFLLFAGAGFLMTFVLTAEILAWTLGGMLALELLLVLIFSNLVVEEFARGNFFFDGILGSLAGATIGLGAVALFAQFGVGAVIALGLPALCFSLTLGVGIAESAAAQIYALYGIDLTRARLDEADASG